MDLSIFDHPEVIFYGTTRGRPVRDPSVRGGWRWVAGYEVSVNLETLTAQHSRETTFESAVAHAVKCLRLPLFLEGVPVLYTYTDRPQLHFDPKEFHEPMVGGISFGHKFSSATGTYGRVVYDKVTGEKLLLTNAHIGWPNLKIGDEMVQPGPANEGVAYDAVSLHVRHGEFHQGVVNPIDAAVSRPTGWRDIDPVGYHEVGFIPNKPATDIPHPGTYVYSMGRNQNLPALTEGSAIEEGVVSVEFPDGNIYQVEAIKVFGMGTETTPPPGGFSEPGRSGSPVLIGVASTTPEELWNAPLGLIFAGSPTGPSYVTRATLIEKHLGVNFMPVEVDVKAGPAREEQTVTILEKPVLPTPKITIETNGPFYVGDNITGTATLVLPGEDGFAIPLGGRTMTAELWSPGGALLFASAEIMTGSDGAGQFLLVPLTGYKGDLDLVVRFKGDK